MARRRKEGEEGSRGFQFPEFDENEFIRKEVIGFRSSLVVLGWALVAAIVSFLIWIVAPTPRAGWYIGLAIMAGLGYLLRFILPRLKVDIAHFKRKEWLGTGALYFFTWLAFFVFIVNPPIYDGVAPDIEVHITPGAQYPGESVNVTLIASDNHRVDAASLRFEILDPAGERVAGNDALRESPHPNLWSLQFTPAEAGTYTIHATVADHRSGIIPSGPHSTTTSLSFPVGDIIVVRMSGMDQQGVGHLTTSGDRVEVELPPSLDVFRAHLRFADGGSVPLVHDAVRSDDDRLVYYAEARFAGFQGGTSNFTVHVEEHASYFIANKYGVPRIESPLVSPSSYTVNVRSDVLGDHVPELPGERPHTIQPVPGVEAALLLAAIVGVAFVMRRRRNAA